MKVGVFYRLHNAGCPIKSRVLNFEIPEDADPQSYPIVNVAREKLHIRYPDAISFTIVAISRIGPIETDGEFHVQS